MPVALAGTLLGVPMLLGIGYLVAGAFGYTGNASPSAPGRVLTDPQVLRSVALSLWIATIGTAVSLVGALIIALCFGGNSAVDRFARKVSALPLPVPTLAAAIAVLLLLSQSGWVSRAGFAMQLVSTPAQFPALVYDRLAIGVIVAVVWKELPFLALVALSLQSLRGVALADAARTLGATRWQALRTITLPLLMRGLAPSIVAVFVFVFGSLELALVLAPSSPLAVPMLIQERRQALDSVAHGDAYVIALAASAIALLAAVLHEALRAER